MKSADRDDELFATHPDPVDFTEGHRIEPLIGGQATFAAIERAIEEASRSIHMAYWTLDPALKTTKNIKAETLTDLLREVVKRGVELRIVIADFDPVIGSTFHLDAWNSYRKLSRITEGLDKDATNRLSVMCSRHDTRWGPVARAAAQPILRFKLAEKIAEINEIEPLKERRDAIANAPGLWPFITFDGKSAKVRKNAFPGFYPAAHHEKLCVIDDRIVFLGGLDINAKRQDDWDHDNAFPWHDVACRLEGPVARFFASHFRSRWNEEREDSLAFMKNAMPPDSIAPLPDGIGIPKLDTEVAECPAIEDGVEVKPLRTLSRQNRAWFSRSPRKQIMEIKDAYLDVISKAEDFLYIENQYIRSTPIAKALADRATANKKLELILVLPLIPEDAFVEEEPNIATRHGQYLREKNTDLLYDAFGKRIGIYSMQMPRDDILPDPEKDDADDIIKNTIYIHAKTLVCDDKTAIIGSANLNERSLVTDTETAIVWRDLAGTRVRDYRVLLWQHALDMDTSDWTSDHLSQWNRIAKANAKGDADERQGFIVTFPRRHLDAHARRSWLVPDELV
ncbi:phospholipase D-like domain-containing protein [Pararhizobium haloflavum]|uniref:phospholipase D-like domain-containing protein n=1 Tax=Pararhizobium haloflavum TaxID=2037914 RepID=UPI000C189384|nr:phospholipase D family protein [Pararhizobium haloflavum]